ncbi:MAG TPA: hypothetical protein VG146_14685 [Verrucomicrobiae bacterium]|nr:hypothetical protein [Verrucomicrobiae bacterium]
MERLRQILVYLCNPSLNEYYRLKTENLRYDFNLTPRAIRVLGKAGARSPSITARQTVGDLWGALARGTKTKWPTRLTAVCLDNVAAVTSSTNSVPTMLGGRLFKSMTIAYDALNPGFHYRPPAGHQALPSQLFLNLSFYARSNVSTNPGPVHISLVWSDPDANWALNRMLSDVHLNLNTMF